MSRICLLPFLFLLASPAAAAPEWRQAREIDVLMAGMDIQPARIEAKAGQPLRLRLINNGGTIHSFDADEFFAAAEVRGKDRDAVSGGTIVVGPGETREILLVPAAGRYFAHCRNLIHRILGMNAKIIVE